MIWKVMREVRVRECEQTEKSERPKELTLSKDETAEQ